MLDFPILASILVILVFLSAFFSSSETSMMSLNRYRLRHLSKTGHKGAQKAEALLQQTDLLIGVILIGNNFINILASAIATVMAIHLFGEEKGVPIATVFLTIVLLIFAEITPKTIAAFYPERIAFPAAHILKPLLTILLPLVKFINLISRGLLRPFGININNMDPDNLSQDELRILVNASETLLSAHSKKMLVGILDLEQVTVDDIMVPRNEVVGLNINDSIKDIVQQLRNSQHTRLPVYKDDFNNTIGILHMRRLGRFFAAEEEEQNKATLLQCTAEPYYIPEGTSLYVQLANFQKRKRRVGLVVDEYGNVQGIVTLEDILEEIVGEFTTDFAEASRDFLPQKDGSYIVDGSTSLRQLNRVLKWNLPTDGPKTLNGLIIENLESIPASALCLKINSYIIEIKQVKDNAIKTAKIFKPAKILQKKHVILNKT